MLGHDMRSPEKVSEAASRLINSGARMQALLDDMLDFNRTKLGLGINIAPTNVDLAKLFADELNLVQAAHPGHGVELEDVGDVQGVWDGRRLLQLLRNLVLNAFKYGAPKAPVRVMVTGEATDVRFEVKNSGPAIERSTLDRIFDPLHRGEEHQNRYDADGNLGLGLYIARAIAKAHGGEIEARSDVTETVFTVVCRAASSAHDMRRGGLLFLGTKTEAGQQEPVEELDRVRKPS